MTLLLAFVFLYLGQSHRSSTMRPEVFDVIFSGYLIVFAWSDLEKRWRCHAVALLCPMRSVFFHRLAAVVGSTTCAPFGEIRGWVRGRLGVHFVLDECDQWRGRPDLAVKFPFQDRVNGSLIGCYCHKVFKNWKGFFTALLVAPILVCIMSANDFSSICVEAARNFRK